MVRYLGEFACTLEWGRKKIMPIGAGDVKEKDERVQDRKFDVTGYF